MGVSLTGEELSLYVKNLSALFNAIQTLEELPSVKVIAEYIKLIEYKVGTGILPELNISDKSGMVSIYEITGITGEKSSLEIALAKSFTLEEIRDRIITKSCTAQAEGLAALDISEEMGSLARRYYLRLLQDKEFSRGLAVSATFLEEAHGSDLIGIQIAGYYPSLSTFCSCEVDLYQDKKIGSRKAAYRLGADTLVRRRAKNALEGSFGLESNLVYQFLEREKFKPRRVSRLVIGPLYSKALGDSDLFSRVDPNLGMIREIVAKEKPNCYVLGVHCDQSTIYFDPSEESDNEAPLLEIRHFYLCGQSLTQKLADQLPKGQVLAVENAS